jgi:L-threonylcarbamoyladenylate synthase
MTVLLPPTSDSIRKVAEILRGGDVVALPTETVYGLGADASNSMAVAKIYALKSRPQFNPLIVHGASVEQLEQVAVFDDRAREIAHHFWAGPLTLILPLKENAPVSDLVTAGLNTIAVRVPAHDVFQSVLNESNLLIAAPSANRSGEVSPTAPYHVAQSLGDDCPLMIAGGTCRVGLESTILDLSETDAKILRTGAITADDIFDKTGIVISYATTPDDDTGAVKSPGQLLKHYAPSIPVRLNAVDVAPNEALLAFGSMKFMGVRGGGFARDLPRDQWMNLSETGDLTEAATHLFAYLRALDRAEFSGIAVMNIPQTGIGLAINDRLARAAAGR